MPTRDLTLETAFQLSKDCHAGLLATASAEGSPHSAWMATLRFRGWDYLDCLTLPESRKVTHLEQNPHSEWLFTAEDYSQVVYLRGTSTVIRSVSKIKSIWQGIPDKSHPYFLFRQSVGLGMVAIETLILEVETLISVSGQTSSWKREAGEPWPSSTTA